MRPLSGLAAAILRPAGLALCLAAPALAQPQPPAATPPAAPAPAATPPAAPEDPVVARVDGEPIHLSDLAAAAQELPEQLRNVPAQRLYPILLDQLISGRAIAAAARAAGLDRDPETRARIRRAEEQELQQAYLSRELAGKMNDQAVRERYDREVASRPAEEEVHARHILVPTEAEAREALAELRNGADFAAVAQRRSSGPGAREGGDLGFFKRGDMVPEFAEAAFGLQPNQLSEPVRSPFGWHVIQVLERRTAPPPRFEEVRDQLRQQMLESEVNALITRIRNNARIERFNLDGSAPRPTDAAQPPPAASPPAPRGQGTPPAIQRR